MAFGGGAVTGPQPIDLSGEVRAIEPQQTVHGYTMTHLRLQASQRVLVHARDAAGKGWALPVSIDDPARALAYAATKGLAAWREAPLPEE